MEKTYKNITDPEDKMTKAQKEKDWLERLKELNLTKEQTEAVDKEFNKRMAKDETSIKYMKAVAKAFKECNQADIKFIGSMCVHRAFDLREKVLKDLGYIK